MPLHPFTYAKMLAENIDTYGAHCWLINTGWSGGKYGEGKRMSLKVTRSIIDAIHDGSLEKATYTTMPSFNFKIPTEVKGVDANILNPINTWKDKTQYNVQLKKLAGHFVKNFEKYHDGTPKEVIDNGGPTTNF